MARILYFVTEDWAYRTFFEGRALAALEAGHEVTLAARENADGDHIRSTGVRFIPINIQRAGINPIADLRLILTLTKIFRRERPDLVHQFALKPILYGTLAAKLCGIRRIVNAPIGMGFVFSSRSIKARALRPAVSLALRLLLNPQGSHVVLENEDDLSSLRHRGLLDPHRSSMIRGAGVSVTRFSPTPEPTGKPIVLLVARMLYDKGIVEFVEAARSLQAHGVEAIFRLVGSTDPMNPTSIDISSLERWQCEGVIEWLGHRSDIPALLADCHIACLPSYREGLPKSLAEAAASGRPIVTTDVPGCREVVRNGIEGLLVPARDASALASALERLIENQALRIQMGAAARRRAVALLSDIRVNSETLKLYDSVLDGFNSN